MATKKKSRKQTGMINLTTLRRMAKKAFGEGSIVEEARPDALWVLRVYSSSINTIHPVIVFRLIDRALARRALKAALEVAVKG